MRKFFTSFAIVGALTLTIGLAAAFASHAGYSLFGDAQIVPGGNPGNAVQLRSDASPGFGGVDYDVPTTTFAEFTTLATDYKFEADDTCGGGSPRFQINVVSPSGTDTGNIFVYIGPPPAYTLCPPNVWTNTGDLLEGVNPIDTSQLDGGTFYDPYATALIKYGGYTVTGVQLVVDGAWFPLFADGEQTGLFDNTNIDGDIFTYDEGRHATNKDDCKDGGWMDLVRDDGSTFKNQGDCVSYTNTGK
jgi:hypothetical protein